MSGGGGLHQCELSGGGGLHQVWAERWWRTTSSLSWAVVEDYIKFELSGGGGLHQVWAERWWRTTSSVSWVVVEHYIKCELSGGGGLHQVWAERWWRTTSSVSWVVVEDYIKCELSGGEGLHEVWAERWWISLAFLPCLLFVCSHIYIFTGEYIVEHSHPTLPWGPASLVNKHLTHHKTRNKCRALSGEWMSRERERERETKAKNVNYFKTWNPGILWLCCSCHCQSPNIA